MESSSDPEQFDLSGLTSSLIDFNTTTTALTLNESEFQRMFHNLNATLSEHYVWWSLATKTLIVIVYCLLITVSLIGNCLVIRVLLCVKFDGNSTTPTTISRTGNSGFGGASASGAGGTLLNSNSRSHRLRIRTGTGTSKLLIVNLAISDLLLTTFNIPVNLFRYLSDDWPFGENVCRLVPFVQSVSAYCSAWTMLFIAFERFRKIIQQQKFHRRLASQQQQHPYHHHHHHHPHHPSPIQPNHHHHDSQHNSNYDQKPSCHKTCSSPLPILKSSPQPILKSDTTNTSIPFSPLQKSPETFHKASSAVIQESCFYTHQVPPTTIVSSTDSTERIINLSSSNSNNTNKSAKQENSFFHRILKLILKFSHNCLCFCPTRIMSLFFGKQHSNSKIIVGKRIQNCDKCDNESVPFYELNPIGEQLTPGIQNSLSCGCDNKQKSKKAKPIKISKRTELDSWLYRRLPAWLILSLVWGVSLILSYPHSLHTGLYPWRHPHPTVGYMISCRFNLFPDDATRSAQSLYTFVSQYAIPIILTSLCYLHIGIFLWRRETVGALSESRRALMLKRKRRRVRMLIFVVLVFAACWAPLNVYRLVTDYKWMEENQGLFFFLHMIAMSSVCYNPFIYCWLNEAFRRKAQSVLRCLLPCGGSLQQIFHSGRRCLRNIRRAENPIAPIFAQPRNGNDHQGRGGSGNEELIDCQIGNDGRGSCVGEGLSVRLDGPTGERSSTWSSSTMSATGKQQAISELISMSALLEQDLMDSSKRYSTGNSNSHCVSGSQQSSPDDIPVINLKPENIGGEGTSTGNEGGNEVLATGTGGVAKQERLAFTTTQSGKRRLHVDAQL